MEKKQGNAKTASRSLVHKLSPKLPFDSNTETKRRLPKMSMPSTLQYFSVTYAKYIHIKRLKFSRKLVIKPLYAIYPIQNKFTRTYYYKIVNENFSINYAMYDVRV